MPPQRAPRPSARQPRACAVPPAGGEFPGSAARDPPRPLGPPPALAHPLAVRLSFPGGRDFRAEPGPQRAPPSRAAAWAGRAVGRSAAAAAAAGAQQPASPTAARPLAGPPPPGAMAGSSSLEAVRRKIRSLQEQADAAEERAGSLQRELDYERKLRETVRDPPITHHQRRLLPDRPPGAPQGLPEPTFSTPPPASGGTWRTWARRCRLGRGLAPSPRPFFISLVYSQKNRGESRSGVEKVLEAPLSQKGLCVGCLRSTRRLGSPEAKGCALCPPGIIYPEGGDKRGPSFWKSVLLGRTLTDHVRGIARF